MSLFDRGLGICGKNKMHMGKIEHALERFTFESQMLIEGSIPFAVSQLQCLMCRLLQ